LGAGVVEQRDLDEAPQLDGHFERAGHLNIDGAAIFAVRAVAAVAIQIVEMKLRRRAVS
jgi:hypothetical protein